MTSTEVFDQIKEGLTEALQIARGEAEPLRTIALMNDGAGYRALADKADVPVPSPSPNAASGRDIYADPAGDITPDAAPYDDAGQSMHADQASGCLPASSPKAEVGRLNNAETAKTVLPASALIDQLAELQVRRKFWIKLANRQSNAALALIRRAIGWRYDEEEEAREKINKRAASIFAAAQSGKAQKPEDAAIFAAVASDLAVITASMEPGANARHEIELEMARTARKLPVYPWAKAVRGLGEVGLAVIVGEAGDLSSYPKKGHLWKRLGLAPFEGQAYSTWRMKGGLTAEQWTEAGYSPGRRAEIFAVIGDPLFRAQSSRSNKENGEITQEAGPYRLVYDRRRAATAIAHPDWTKAHSHADGLRVMTKIMLRDLWSEWNLRSAGAFVPNEATLPLPTGEPIRESTP